MKLKKNEVLIIRRCTKKNISHKGFKYPIKKGSIVEAKDWNNNNCCGGGLHGGTDGFTRYFGMDLVGYFQIILVNKKDGYIELDSKVKFRKGTIIYNGKDKEKAHSIIKQVYPNIILHWDNQTADHNSTQTAGHGSTQKAKSGSTQKAEYDSTQEAWFYSTQTADHNSTQTAGPYSFINNYVNEQTYNIVKPSMYSVVSSINVIKDIANSFISNTFDTVYVINGKCKIDKEYTTTLDNIKSLKEYEIIVFGSNEKGNHKGGLAKTCKDKFGAEEGISSGITGKCFAINTMSGKEEIKEGLIKLGKEAYKQSGKIFLLTKIGQGIAGYLENDIKELVENTDLPANVIKWYKEL